jgi:hypothetical protein
MMIRVQVTWQPAPAGLYPLKPTIAVQPSVKAEKTEEGARAGGRGFDSLRDRMLACCGLVIVRTTMALLKRCMSFSCFSAAAKPAVYRPPGARGQAASFSLVRDSAWN